MLRGMSVIIIANWYEKKERQEWILYFLHAFITFRENTHATASLPSLQDDRWRLRHSPAER